MKPAFGIHREARPKTRDCRRAFAVGVVSDDLSKLSDPSSAVPRGSRSPGGRLDTPELLAVRAVRDCPGSTNDERAAVVVDVDAVSEPAKNLFGSLGGVDAPYFVAKANEKSLEAR